MQRITGVAGAKLALNKATLRTLGDAELRDAAGGQEVVITTCGTRVLTTGVTVTTATQTLTNQTTTTVHTQPDPSP